MRTKRQRWYIIRVPDRSYTKVKKTDFGANIYTVCHSTETADQMVAWLNSDTRLTFEAWKADHART